MSKFGFLKLALMGGASVVALSSTALAEKFDIPSGDLESALSRYSIQTGIPLIVSADEIKGIRTKGARGDLSPTVALADILGGTGFVAHPHASGEIGVARDVETRKAPIRVAAAAPRAPAPGAIETVVVTAQHKSENIQNVPIAVTALSQAQLTERQIAGGPDLVKEVPNLTFSKTNFTGYNLEIRGIGTQAISVTTDPAVAVAFNDIPFIRNHFFEQEFYDLRDVEVLRGPQGTLYGRNATAGVVNVKSALPDDQYEAMLSADMGNYFNRRLEGMINIPIVGDKLDIRIAGEWTKRDGYSFNTTLGTPIDGRDLWSGRVTLGWKPVDKVQAYLVWEHFSEDDDRMRTAKQLCKTDPGPTAVPDWNGNLVPLPTGIGYQGGTIAPGDYLSQGCLPASLYSKDSFEVPNGYSLPYYSGLTGADLPIRVGFNPYASTVQSTNLRDIQASINPIYKAKNDTLELNVDYSVAPALNFISQTGYNQDFLWSTEDYNRFDTAPGIFVYGNRDAIQGTAILPDPAAGKNGVPADAGIFCDPQLGCSDRLVAQDLSDEHAWQLSQEFRLASSFDGPLNFSIGGNFLHYETNENYYVFINTLTDAALYDAGSEYPYVGGMTDNSSCIPGGFRLPNPSAARSVIGYCKYIDPNPIASLDGQGHNYFRSQNPYLLNSYAGFGEAYYNLANDLKLTGGLRWTVDQKHFLEIPSEVLVPGYGYSVTDVVSQQWSQLTGRSVIDWTPKLDFTDQTLIYGSYSHGYKAGGANPPGAVFPTTCHDAIDCASATIDPLHPLTFKPEFVDAYELGTKNTMLDGALTLNGDVFYYNYKNYQISRIVDRTAINDNFNATVRGAELETNWEPAPGWKFSFAGGYENATLDKGDQSVDLIDRTAGIPGWIVVKPFVTQASNCVLPAYVVAAILDVGFNNGGNLPNACIAAYGAHEDPVTGLPFVENPTVRIGGSAPPAGYPGFDPLSIDPTAPSNVNNGLGLPPNNGQGFEKNLSGNQLPNAPHFTTSLSAEYTLPVSDDWAATLHGDFYWQSQSWARVFNDRPYDKLRGYSNVNLSIILTSANGWQVMGYVKNVFDVTAITGDFLNSDDTGLTTNVFLTDPRLYGVRITKQLDQNDGFWGSDWSGYDFFTNLSSDTDNGKPPLWIELGGQLESLSGTEQAFAPPFMASINRASLLSALKVQKFAPFAIDEDAKISFQPDNSDWLFSASIQFGRSRANLHHHHQTANKPVPVRANVELAPPYSGFDKFFQPNYDYFYPYNHVRYADGQSSRSERHLILDFEAGKDVGLGMFGIKGTSVVSAGMRIASFISKSSTTLRAQPDLQYPTAPIGQTAPITNITQLAAFESQKSAFLYATVNFHAFRANEEARRSFHGLGPELSWNASTPVADNDAGEGLMFDWGINAGVLFGRQQANVHHQTQTQSYHMTRWERADGGFLIGHTAAGKPEAVGHFANYAAKKCSSSYNGNGGCFNYTGQATHVATNAGGINRSRMVTVPNIGAFVGLSMKYQNAKISFGYRADEFFGAIDGGIDTQKSENRGFFGPYANIAIGLGG